METKENFSTNLLKRFYGVQGTLDEYRRHELYKIGNTAFMITFYYNLFSAFIAILVWGSANTNNLNVLENIFFWYAFANLLFVVFGISGYIIFATKRKHLLDNEVLDIKSQNKRLVHLSIRQGIQFGILIFIFSGVTSPHFTEFTSVHTFIIDVFLSGGLFGVLMYGFQRLNIKTVKE